MTATNELIETAVSLSDRLQDEIINKGLDPDHVRRFLELTPKQREEVFGEMSSLKLVPRVETPARRRSSMGLEKI